MDIKKDISWKLFTDEERGMIMQCYKNGDWQNITCLPYVPVDTPERELELQKIVLALRVIEIDDVDSEVRKDLSKFWQDGNELTPEKEAEFQERLDVELKDQKAKVEAAQGGKDKDEDDNDGGVNKEGAGENNEKEVDEPVASIGNGNSDKSENNQEKSQEANKQESKIEQQIHAVERS